MKSTLCLTLLTASTVLPLTASAQTTWTNPGTGSWFSESNWSGGVPQGVEIAEIGEGTAEVDAVDAIFGFLDITGNGAVKILADSSLVTPSDGMIVIRNSTLAGAALTVSGGDPDEDGYGIYTVGLLVGLHGTGRMLVDNGGVYADGGDLDNPSTWTTIGGAPVSGVTPLPAEAGTGELTVTGDASFRTRQVLVVGGYDGTGTLNVLAGGSAEVFDGMNPGVLLVGAGDGTAAVGNVTVSGAASNLTAANIGLGINFTTPTGIAGSGTLTVADGGLVTADTIILGPYDPGTDLVSSGHIQLDGTAGSRGVLSLGGQIMLSRGTLSFDGGVLKFGDNGVAIDIVPSGSGSVTLGTGGGFFDTNGFNVQVNAPIDGAGALHKLGTGTLTLVAPNSFTGGVVVEDGRLFAGAAGTLPESIPYVVNDGELDLGGHTLKVSSLSGTGGVVDIDGNFIVEQNDADTTFGGTIVSDGAADFYKWGSKKLTVQGGMPSDGNIQVIVQGGELALGSTSTLKGVHVGNLGTTGTLTVANGSLTVTDYLTVGEDTGSVGTLNIGVGGTLTMDAGAALTVGFANGIGTLNIQPGGTLEVGGANGLATAGAVSSTVNFSGTIKVVGSALESSVPLALTSASATVNTNGLDATFSGPLTGAGGLVKTGAGKLSLSGSNAYTGLTTVSAGTLELLASDTLDSSSGIAVASGATLQNSSFGTVTIGPGRTLSGAGSITGAFALSGTLAPGDDGIGTLTAETITWDAGGHFVFDLGSMTSDLLDVGDLIKGGDGDYVFDFVDDGWQVGETYTLIAFENTDFTEVDFSFSNGEGFSGTFAIEGNTLTFQLTAVPEPSSWALSMAALLATLVVFRRQRSVARSK